MQTSYSNNLAVAVEGAPYGDFRRARSLGLPWLEQQTQIRIASSEAGDLVITVVDDETQQSYALTVAISGAVEATSLDEMVAAWQANATLNALATVTEDGVDDMVITFRHANRAYTVTTTPPGSMTAVVSELQASGGSGVEVGRFVARGTGDNDYAALTATTTLANLVGVLHRTDGNHLHSLESDTPSAVDALDRARVYSVMYDGGVWMVAEDAVTPASTPYVRRATTSGAGAVGRVRGTPAGVATETWTVAPTVNHQVYEFSFGFLGQDYTVQYTATDATTAVADAIDGLYDALNEVLVDAGIDGLIATAESDTLLTLTVDAGYALDYCRNNAWGLDTEAVSTVVTNTVAADVDTIDISSIAEFESTAGAGELVRLRLKL